MRAIAKRVLPPILLDLFRGGARPAPAGAAVATYRAEFAEFVAGRRGIALSEARRLVDAAAGQFEGGWGGNDYRRFTELALETFRPLYGDATESELLETYRFHGGLDFLRMLGYAVPDASELQPILQILSKKQSVRVVDYGCGLAQRSIAVARALIAGGAEVELVLVDVRRDLHFDFLTFLCRKHAVPMRFVEVTANGVYPALPAHDYCEAVSVLEHLRDPVAAIGHIDAALHPGGLLLASVEDEMEEMMHVSTDLSAVRARLGALGYSKMAQMFGATLFRKP
jgi:SAM-dependent methyltransferase